MGYTVSKAFGSKVFSDSVMRERLPRATYESLKKTRDEGLPLDPEVAQVVAGVMKDWAVEQGATHYTHWFQPMTNITAGKHDSFVSPSGDGRAILEFSGKALAMGEPDASSFPSGGLRATFEARGYTAWDATSPAFVRGTSLYIPTAFCSFTGETLDRKTPLLRSMDVLSTQALRVLRCLGNETARRVTATIGAEQEYFLIDRALYEKRLDLKICGRTLFGARPPKGQELDDHYCGRIRLRVADFMQELDERLWELGVPSKTKHNEVAPAQHELAPMFTSANIACDHNQLIMELMRVVAKQKGLACLLHEKPFAGVNGSGKHNNWSLSTDDGQNLLDPGKNPAQNRQFLLFLCAVIRAVDEYADLLRMTAASAGNDHRLGGHEAPPAVISIFLGESLTSILEHIAYGSTPERHSRGYIMEDIAALPTIHRDDCDRNRTSPFAFTGNKFEYRMVGSSASIASATYVLNTAVADVLSGIADRLSAAQNREAEIDRIIGEIYKQHGRVVFNGNNYSEAWANEAARRGLPVKNRTVEAVEALVAPKNIALFKRHGIFTEAECRARYEILLEQYVKTVSIEEATMTEMVRRQILPAALRYTGALAGEYTHMREAGVESATAKALLAACAALTDAVQQKTDALEASSQSVQALTELPAQAAAYRDEIIPQMQAIREDVDRLETMTEDSAWPMPSYTDLLHRV